MSTNDHTDEGGSPPHVNLSLINWLKARFCAPEITPTTLSTEHNRLEMARRQGHIEVIDLIERAYNGEL